jgi:hypothetical protein
MYVIFTFDIHFHLHLSHQTRQITLTLIPTHAQCLINIKCTQPSQPKKDSSSTNTMADSVNANLSHDQADDQAIQLHSTSFTNIMADSTNANISSLHRADHQIASELLSTSATNTAADSIIDSFSRDQADHQVNSKPSLTSITTAHHQEQEQTLEAGAAVSAVLGITELLLLIVSAVPFENRTSLRRVSKMWHAAVSRVGYTLEPVHYGGSTPQYSVESGGNMYGYYQTLELNRSPAGLVLKKEGRMIFGRRFDAVKQVSLGLCNAKKLYMHEHEFITDPPITQVLIDEKLNRMGVVASGFAGAVLRVRGGIRVGDLLECLRKLDPNLTRTKLHAKYYVRFAWQLQWTDEDEGRRTRG